MRILVITSGVNHVIFTFTGQISNLTAVETSMRISCKQPFITSNNICYGANENDPHKGIVEIEVETDPHKCYDVTQSRAFTNAASNTTTVSNIPIGYDLTVTLIYYEFCGRCDNFNQVGTRNYRVAFRSVTFFSADQVINNSALQLNVPAYPAGYDYICP